MAVKDEQSWEGKNCFPKPEKGRENIVGMHFRIAEAQAYKYNRINGFLFSLGKRFAKCLSMCLNEKKKRYKCDDVFSKHNYNILLGLEVGLVPKITHNEIIDSTSALEFQLRSVSDFSRKRNVPSPSPYSSLLNRYCLVGAFSTSSCQSLRRPSHRSYARSLDNGSKVNLILGPRKSTSPTDGR